ALQGVNHMHSQSPLHGIVRQADGSISIEVPNHPFASFINKEGVAAHTSIFHCGISWQDLGINVAENHLGRRTIVPRHAICPELRFMIEKWPQVRAAEMPEIEDFHAEG